MRDDRIVLFEFEESEKGVVISFEKHYRLLPPEEIDQEELTTYQGRNDNE